MPQGAVESPKVKFPIPVTPSQKFARNILFSLRNFFCPTKAGAETALRHQERTHTLLAFLVADSCGGRSQMCGPADNNDDDALLDERALESGNGTTDRLRAVIYGFGQA